MFFHSSSHPFIFHHSPLPALSSFLFLRYFVLFSPPPSIHILNILSFIYYPLIFAFPQHISLPMCFFLLFCSRPVLTFLLQFLLIEMYFRVAWKDPRLIFPQSSVNASSDASEGSFTTQQKKTTISVLPNFLKKVKLDFTTLFHS